ncbi:hypothetical protein Tco_1351794 [Tanacetum coccineum]
MLLYIKGKENGKLLVDSVLNGPFIYGTITVPKSQTTPTTVRERTYDELTDAGKLHDSCDIKATNIVLQGLPQDIYNLERESKLYNEFDMFTSVHGETIHSYYLRQHEAHADEVRIMKERFPNPLALVANTYNSSPSYSNQTQYYQQISPFASEQQVLPIASQQLYNVPMIQQHSSQVIKLLVSDVKEMARIIPTKPTLEPRQTQGIEADHPDGEGVQVQTVSWWRPKRRRSMRHEILRESNGILKLPSDVLWNQGLFLP